MKRLLTISILIIILICLCACGKKASDEVPESMIAKISEAVDNASQAEGQGAVTVVTEGTDSTAGQSTTDQSTTAAAAAAQAAVPTPSPTPVPTVAPTATPAPTARVYNVTITKDPTGETVEEGGSATFIARANNATSINWIIVSPDAQTSFRAEEVPSHFAGVSISGQGTESLTIFNIPSSMNGWRIQCYFTGNGGPEYTMGAYITVTASAEKKQTAISLANDCAAAVGTHAENAAPGIWTNTGASSFSFSNDTGKFVVTLKVGENRVEVTCLCFPDNYAYYPVEIVWSTVNGTAVTQHTDLILTKATTYDKTADLENWSKLEAELQKITSEITLVG